MIFLEKLKAVLGAYDNHVCEVKDGAFLYGVHNPAPPLATHIVFAPMPKEVMQNLIASYRLIVPVELLTLYSVMNGANLFWKVRLMGDKKTRIPYNCFSIYGVPLTWDRKRIEPFNLSVEDLNRPNGTPNSWLKFGSYYVPENETNKLDLYVDTETSAVFAVEHNNDECCVVSAWTSIDDCLCFIVDLLSTQKAENGSLS